MTKVNDTRAQCRDGYPPSAQCLSELSQSRSRITLASMRGSFDPVLQRAPLGGICAWCGGDIEPGSEVITLRALRATVHRDCITEIVWLEVGGG